MKTETFLFSALAVCAASVTAEPRVPYSNDFTTRSSGPVPSGRWMETAYVAGPMSACLASAAITDASPYVGAGAYQDGWAPKSGWSSGSVEFSVVDDGGNMCAVANGTVDSFVDSSSVVLQPFANEFTTGTLRIAADIRTPPQSASFNPSGNAFAMVAPVYRAALGVTSVSFPIPLRFGPGSMSSGGEWNLRALTRGKASAGGSGANFGQYDTRNAIQAGGWVRYEAVLNLDAGTYTATFASLGTAHPTTETLPGEAFDFRTYEPGGGGSAAPTTLYFDSAMTEATGGIAGLAFHVLGLKRSAASAAPMFDNVRVWHNGELVYGNDFSLRRYRSLVPAGTTAGAYAVSPATNAVASAMYGHGSWTNDYGVSETTAGLLVPESGTANAPCEGWDGWRRRAGGAGFSLLNPNKNGGYGWNNKTVLRVTKKNTLGVLSVPLGTTVTSGKVRLYFDLMPGRKSVLGDYNEAFAMCFLSGNGMGVAPYTGSTSRDTIWKGSAVCGAGYYVNGSAGQELNPGNVVYGAGTLKANYSPTTSAMMCNWHRYVVTADLDARSYQFAAYRYGTTGQPAEYDISALEPLAASSSLAFMTDAPASIDSLFIASQGHGAYNTGTLYSGTDLMYGKFPLFDNIRVCLVNADGSDGLELFRCDFDGGVRQTVRTAAALDSGVDRTGSDRWIERGAPYGSIAVLRDASDGTVVLSGMNDGPGFAVQPFGATTKNATSATFAADVRPPSCWSVSGGYALVEVGGDEYFQGVSSPAGAWRVTAPRLSFGFADNGSGLSFGRSAAVKIAAGTQAGLALSAAAVDTTHWYRFRVRTRPAQGSCDVDVFDQGSAKPSAADADGALVAAFANVALPAFGANGMTTFGLGGSGISATLGGGLDDPTVALVDNLSAGVQAPGMCVFVR